MKEKNIHIGKNLKIVLIAVAILLSVIMAVAVILLVIVPLVKEADIKNYEAPVTAKISDVKTYYSFGGALSSQVMLPVKAVKIGVVAWIVAVGTEVSQGDKVVEVKNSAGVVESITAPIDGTVSDTYSIVGASVKVDTTLLDICDLDNFQFTISVSEYDIGNIVIGDKVAVNLNTNAKARYNATIRSRSINATPTGGVGYFKVIIAFNKTTDYASSANDKDDESPFVRAGMTCKVRLPKNIVTDVVMLPMKSIQMDGSNKAFVNVLNDKQKIERKYIVLGLNNGDTVEIKSGITAGTKVYYPKPSSNSSILDGLKK